MPIVSIITPTYNRPARLRECVQTVLAQTISDWEHIIIDDGSEVPAREVVGDINDPRVRVIRQKHAGIWHLADTCNLALENARGEFVALLDDDDQWPPDKLERQLLCFANPDVALSWGGAEIVDSEGRVVGRLPKDASVFRNASLNNTPPGAILRELLTRNIIVACTVVIRKQALLEIRGFQKGLPCIDYPTWLALSLKAPFAFCPETCGLWRIYAAQNSNQIGIEQEENAARLALEIFDNLPAEMRACVGIRRRVLLARNRDRVAEEHLLHGRFSALGHRRTEALKKFWRAFWKGQARTRAKAAAAIVLTALRADVEKYVKLYGGTPLQAGLGQR